MKGPARTKSTKAISNRSNGRRDLGTAGSLSPSALNEIRCCLSCGVFAREKACPYCRNNDDRSRRSGGLTESERDENETEMPQDSAA